MRAGLASKQDCVRAIAFKRLSEPLGEGVQMRHPEIFSEVRGGLKGLDIGRSK